MLIKCLVENTSSNCLMETEHGLSLYIEVNSHKILFDLGASGLFVENAKKMNVDLEAVDCVVISHGHYDHGGGLKSFLEVNKEAKVYVQRHAFEKHYATDAAGNRFDIGLDADLMMNKQIVLVDHLMCMDEGLILFSSQLGTCNGPSSNGNLFKSDGESIELDDFSHEINLLVSEGEHNFLVAGCAHGGIMNIINKSIVLGGQEPKTVIGGFHFKSRIPDLDATEFQITQLATALKAMDSHYYTCHCTGLGGYEVLKRVLQDQVMYLDSGKTVIL